MKTRKEVNFGKRKRQVEFRRTTTTGGPDDPSAHGTLQCAQWSGRIPKSDDESRIEENRGFDRLRDAAAHRITRDNPITRAQEQRTDTVHIRNTRLQQRFREQQIQEWLTSDFSHTGRVHKIDRRNLQDSHSAILLQEHNFRRMNERTNGTPATEESSYGKGTISNIKDESTKLCTCCGGTWFPSQVSDLNTRTISSKYPNFSLDNAFYLNRQFSSPSGKYQFCSTRRQGVFKGRIPSLCLSNCFDFPEIPECLKNLTCLEERLISLRIPFMRILSLGYERQCGIRGAVVSVPISVPDTVSLLPRTFDSTHVIQVHLKRN